jgi:hypothetical protein
VKELRGLRGRNFRESPAEWLEEQDNENYQKDERI